MTPMTFIVIVGTVIGTIGLAVLVVLRAVQWLEEQYTIHAR